MVRRRAIAAVLAFCAVGAFHPRGAFAFCRTTTVAVPADFNPRGTECWTEGKLLFWKNRCISFSIQEDASSQIPLGTAGSLTTAGFAAWNNVACPNGTGAPTIAVGPLETVACKNVEYTTGGPNANIVIFRDDGWPHSDGVNTVALTTVTFNFDTGEIYDADIEVNTFARQFSTTDPVPRESYDYLSAITHEAGHFLGLAHSQTTDSTMYALYQPGTTNIRALAADDVEGICAVYPASGSRPTSDGNVAAGPCNGTPRGSFSSLCAADAPPPSQPSKAGGCSLGRAGGFVARSSALWAIAWVAFVAAGRTRLRRRRGARVPSCPVRMGRDRA
jgi:hypothetical protein